MLLASSSHLAEMLTLVIILAFTCSACAVQFNCGDALLQSRCHQSCEKPIVIAPKDCPATGWDCSDVASLSNFIQTDDWKSGAHLRCDDAEARLFVNGKAHSSLRCDKGRWVYGHEDGKGDTTHALCAKECTECEAAVPDWLSDAAAEVSFHSVTPENPCPTAYCSDPAHVLYGVNATGEKSPIEEGNKLFCSGNKEWKDGFGRYFEFAICKACPCGEIRNPLSFFPMGFRQLPPTPVLDASGLCESSYACPQQAALAIQSPSTLPPSLSCARGSNGVWSWFAGQVAAEPKRAGCIEICDSCNVVLPSSLPHYKYNPTTFYYDSDICLRPNPCPNSKLVYWTSPKALPKVADQLPTCAAGKWFIGKVQAMHLGCQASCAPLKRVTPWCPRGHFCSNEDERALVADNKGRYRCIHGGQLYLREKFRLTLKPATYAFCDGSDWRRPSDERAYDGHVCAYKCGTSCQAAANLQGTTEPILAYNQNGCLAASCANGTVLWGYNGPDLSYDWEPLQVCTHSGLWMDTDNVRSKNVFCAKSYPMVRDFYL